MDVAPTPFGRKRHLSQPATVTQGQVLAIKNKQWDQDQEILRLRERDEARQAELEQVMNALTTLDDLVYDLRHPPATVTAINPTVEAAMASREAAFELMVAGAIGYLMNGVDGDELAEALGNSVKVADYRIAAMKAAKS